MNIMTPSNGNRDYRVWLEYFQQQGGFWMFGYGSLMWRPDCAYSESVPGCAEGVSRRYCIISHAYRGTPEYTGRVLGLIKGGCCHGIAFYIQGRDIAASFHALWQREMITNAYLPTLLDVTLRDGRQIQSLGFLADPEHAQYDGSSSDAKVAAIIKTAVGPAGSNLEYFNDTFAQLQKLGVQDDRLSRLNTLLNSVI